MSANDLSVAVKAIERIGKVLGVMFVSNSGKDKEKDRAILLRRCGFANLEIAEMLGMTGNAVNVALHRSRNVRRKSRSTKKKRRIRR